VYELSEQLRRSQVPGNMHLGPARDTEMLVRHPNRRADVPNNEQSEQCIANRDKHYIFVYVPETRIPPPISCPHILVYPSMTRFQGELPPLRPPPLLGGLMAAKRTMQLASLTANSNSVLWACVTLHSRPYRCENKNTKCRTGPKGVTIVLQ
jgi:hypothetical protein